MFEFLATGQYKVILGKSFDGKPKKKAPKYFNVKNKDSLDSHVVFGNEAKLEKKKDRYQVEMKHSNGPSAVYDAELNTEEEYSCILIYNEEKKTITLERQSAQIYLTRRKVDQQQSQQNGHLTHSPLPGNQYATIQTPPIVKEPVKVNDTTSNGPAAAVAASAADDFDFDLSKDLDEILDSDDEGLSDSAGSDTFEEIAASTIPLQRTSSPLSLPVTPSLPPSSPNIPLNLALPSTPTSSTALHASSASPAASSSTTAGKKRKFKMASAPIRHPGIISPLATAAIPPAITTTPPPLNNSKPVAAANKRLKSQHDDSSSSGSEEGNSSSGSESGSTESGSSSGSESESGSGSDSDDDFESLAQDISMSLSKGGPSAPVSPQHHVNTPGVPSPSSYKKSPYDKTTPGHTPTPSNRSSAPSSQQNGGGAGPMSLRALFKEDDEEEDLSSSESDDDSD